MNKHNACRALGTCFWLLVSMVGLPGEAMAVRTGGTDVVVSSITQTGATFSASITTDGAGSGSYTLDFFVTAPYQNFVGGATPSSIPVNGNTTTNFSATTTALRCGTAYTVAGVYLPDNFIVGPSYVSFTTAPCTPEPIPTISEWVMLMLAGLVGILASRKLRHL